jgi:hypothetical protein
MPVFWRLVNAANFSLKGILVAVRLEMPFSFDLSVVLCLD